MGELKLTFFNVGYGEALLLECPDPNAPDGVFTLLLDGGSAESEEFAASTTGRRPLADHLAKHGCKHLDVLVSSHIHEDHLCGMLPAAQVCDGGLLWQSLPADLWRELRDLDEGLTETVSQSKFLRALNDWRSLCALVEERGGAIKMLRAGDGGELCPGLRYQVLGPSAALAAALEKQVRGLYEPLEKDEFLKRLSALDAQMNNYSLILRLEYGGVSILLPGDTNLLGYGDIPAEQLRADLFKVGHHGQLDGADEALLDKVRPQAVVCCASSDRRYNSARPELLQLIADKGATTYFSDCPQLSGLDLPPHEALTFTIGPDGTWSAAYRL